jgi:hypothetical protein
MDKQTKRTFIHIGYPKCASTYLQQEVFPDMGNFVDLTKQPHATKWMLLSDADPAEFRKQIKEVMPCDKPEKDYEIISYEGFVPNLFHSFTDMFWDTRRMEVSQYRNPKRSVVEKLAEAYPDAYIIIIIREQIAWAVSQYKMYWRRGHTERHIDEYINRHEDGYDKVIEEYQKAFGVDKVKVIPFELLRIDPKAFVCGVTEFIDPSHEPSISEKRVNYAPSLLKVVSYQRNKRVFKLKLKADLERSNIFKRVSMRILWHLTNILSLPYYSFKHGEEKDQVTVSDSVIKRVLPGIVASNRKLEQLTGLDLQRFGYRMDKILE